MNEIRVKIDNFNIVDMMEGADEFASTEIVIMTKSPDVDGYDYDCVKLLRGATDIFIPFQLEVYADLVPENNLIIGEYRVGEDCAIGYLLQYESTTDEVIINMALRVFKEENSSMKIIVIAHNELLDTMPIYKYMVELLDTYIIKG